METGSVDAAFKRLDAARERLGKAYDLLRRGNLTLEERKELDDAGVEMDAATDAANAALKEAKVKAGLIF